MASYKRDVCPFTKSTYCGTERCQFWNNNYNRCLLALSAEQFLGIEPIKEEPIVNFNTTPTASYNIEEEDDYEDEEDDSEEENGFLSFFNSLFFHH